MTPRHARDRYCYLAGQYDATPTLALKIQMQELKATHPRALADIGWPRRPPGSLWMVAYLIDGSRVEFGHSETEADIRRIFAETTPNPDLITAIVSEPDGAPLWTNMTYP